MTGFKYAKVTFFFAALLGLGAGAFLYQSSEARKWQRYFAEKADQPARPLFVKAKALLPATGTALALGCGTGNDEVLLIAQGWKVDCVEKYESGSAIMSARAEVEAHPGNLRLIRKDFAELKAADLGGAYDFLYAGFSLPFAGSEHLKEVWSLASSKLKPGGVMAAHFFGEDQKRLNAAHVAYLSPQELDDLLRGFDILDLQELKEQGEHIYEVIARKKILLDQTLSPSD